MQVKQNATAMISSQDLCAASSQFHKMCCCSLLAHPWLHSLAKPSRPWSACSCGPMLFSWCNWPLIIKGHHICILFPTPLLISFSCVCISSWEIEGLVFSWKCGRTLVGMLLQPAKSPTPIQISCRRHKLSYRQCSMHLSIWFIACDYCKVMNEIIIKYLQ